MVSTLSTDPYLLVGPSQWGLPRRPFTGVQDRTIGMPIGGHCETISEVFNKVVSFTPFNTSFEVGGVGSPGAKWEQKGVHPFRASPRHLDCLSGSIFS